MQCLLYVMLIKQNINNLFDLEYYLYLYILLWVTLLVAYREAQYVTLYKGLKYLSKLGLWRLLTA